MVLDEVYITKQLDKCLKRYFGEAVESPLSTKELEELKVKIQEAVNGETGEALYMIIEDIVYEYITN